MINRWPTNACDLLFSTPLYSIPSILHRPKYPCNSKPKQDIAIMNCNGKKSNNHGIRQERNRWRPVMGKQRQSLRIWIQEPVIAFDWRLWRVTSPRDLPDRNWLLIRNKWDALQKAVALVVWYCEYKLQYEWNQCRNSTALDWIGFILSAPHLPSILFYQLNRRWWNAWFSVAKIGRRQTPCIDFLKGSKLLPT